jgi:4-hydroxy-tetrahydrodipicolinate reductase
MKIALIGYGKMGHTIEQVALERGHAVSHRISIDNPHDLAQVLPDNTDVAIEFSEPGAAFANVAHCLRHRVPVVCGTTGWLAQKPEAEALCAQHGGSFFYSSNFSIGVNLFFKVNQVLAGLMNAQPQYDVRMEETHHTEKKDAPSGTALTLAQDIIDRLDRKSAVQLQEDVEPVPADAIAVRAYRIPDVPGTHIITYQSGIDVIEIRHDARSRRGFAHGAVLAAEWLRDKTGVFGMNDLLQL